ncbi:helix-turn-helix domain-containing protein [Streptomyces aureus]|uniref:Helix-turn-helix domain-containing protein n=1 Tax=Streptomyces aureus TaxID=193461 RepID=A0ABV4SZP8_9ACTN
MRHPQGGGLTAERQQFREELRLRAAEGFARGEASSVTAEDLRVSVRSVQRWRQMWDEGGPRAPRSQGPASLPRLSEKQFTQLEAELAKGPAAHGWENQRWTLSCVKTVIGHHFHLADTIQGVRKLVAADTSGAGGDRGASASPSAWTGRYARRLSLPTVTTHWSTSRATPFLISVQE